ncbi:MAG: exodeoxyribonuclease VII large subunit [Sphaerochaetaceae bacterium]|jgi:exodeoxyribonuclease VII large subunit
MDTILTITQLTSLVKESLQSQFSGISVEGEVSNFTKAASGHWYFTLKDESSSLSAVMFKQASWKVGFIPKDGDRLIVKGSLSVYAPRGSYQIICESMVASGVGEILLLLEKRRAEFAALGYFDQERKKNLPLYPKTVGVVTSSTGAVIQDIIKTLDRRTQAVNVILLPAIVQGELSPASISAQIEFANRHNLVDILIVGRGGGSLEDLLSFSDQQVIEAIVASDIPIISAVGHESDWALSDYASDVRASTPTAAAEIVSESWLTLQKNIGQVRQSLHLLMQHKLSLLHASARSVNIGRLGELLQQKVEYTSLFSDDLHQRLHQRFDTLLQLRKHSYTLLSSLLESLSPSCVLQRGYAIVTKNKRVISSKHETEVDDILQIHLSDGEIEVTVDHIKEDESEH